MGGRRREEEEEEEGKVSAAVELIKTVAAGFRGQERNFSVACYKFTIKKKEGKLIYHQTCTRLLLRENCERSRYTVFVRYYKTEWRLLFLSLSRYFFGFHLK